MYSYINVCIGTPLRVLTNEEISRTLYTWTRTVIPKSGTPRADWVVHSTLLSTQYLWQAPTGCPELFESDYLKRGSRERGEEQIEVAISP